MYFQGQTNKIMTFLQMLHVSAELRIVILAQIGKRRKNIEL